MICDSIHRDFRKNFRYAQIWGKSARFPGQIVGLDHVVEDEDVVTVIVQALTCASRSRGHLRIRNWFRKGFALDEEGPALRSSSSAS